MSVMPQSFSFRLHRGWVPVLFSLALAVAPLRAADEPLRYLTAGKPDAIALLAPPPAPDSSEQKFDLAEVVAVHNARTTNEEVIARVEENKLFIFSFTPAIGNYFQPGKFPKTEAFFLRVQKEIGPATSDVKDFWKRPRPYVVDPGLADADMEKSFSYPSGHSTSATIYALLLADLFPDRRDAILETGREIGWRRVMLAKHYPTDVYAGRVLGQAIVREMKKSRRFRKDFAEVKAELAAAPAAKNSN